MRVSSSLLLAMAAVGLISAAPGPTVVKADWLEKPSGEAVNRAYPEEAMVRDISGRAVIACTVRVDGTVGDCAVRSEQPEGLGFGEAALSLADQMRMRPQTVNGVPTDSVVRIPLAFSASAGAAPIWRISWEQRQDCAGEVMAEAERRAIAWPPGQDAIWYRLYVAAALDDRKMSTGELMAGLRRSLAAAEERPAELRDAALKRCDRLLESVR